MRWVVNPIRLRLVHRLWVISPICFGICPNFPRPMPEIKPPKFLINLARTARSMIC